MNLWKGPPYKPTNPDCIYMQFRHTLVLERWFFGLETQVLRDSSSEWEGVDWRGLSVTSHFAIGPQHIWYDGPHCSFSIGWFHFIWSGGWKTGQCKRCESTL